MARPTYHLSPPPERLLVPVAHTLLGNPAFATPICFIDLDLNGPVNLPLPADDVFRGIPSSASDSASGSSTATGRRSTSTVLAGGSLKRNETPDNVTGVKMRLIEDGKLNKDTFPEFKTAVARYIRHLCDSSQRMTAQDRQTVQKYPFLSEYSQIWPVRVLVRESLKDSARQHNRKTTPRTSRRSLRELSLVLHLVNSARRAVLISGAHGLARDPSSQPARAPVAVVIIEIHLSVVYIYILFKKPQKEGGVNGRDSQKKRVFGGSGQKCALDYRNRAIKPLKLAI
ncbi:hypothetical protein C8J57DRAFT_1238805 [Mycena rebaudengoi]|nr:hypothetical protein C8J57DRAFT_1238805 [Mycena rebaudengoi]